jgi:hypothetical protein
MCYRFLYVGLLLGLAAPLGAQTLNLAARPASAKGGNDFALSIASLTLEEREARILAEIRAGNVPPFLRKLVPVSVTAGDHTATYFVTPDYLAVGSDDDYFRTPLSPAAAQAIASELDCLLPTTKMVDGIYASAKIKLNPAPIPPSPAMTTVEVFLRHNAMVQAERAKSSPGALIAGHKKDVVIANRVFETPGRVAIYGWHKRDGSPIQPLYTKHLASWVDYSHGIRLVAQKLTVDGKPTTVEQVLADPMLAPLLSNDGVMRQTRYLTGPAPPSPKDPKGAMLEEIKLEPGVRVVVDRPSTASPKPVLLIIYALPNGNTIEQTIGKAVKPGDDWHFDIQHIGAQTAFLREIITDRRVVVAYLENDKKSWPAWRKAHNDVRIREIVDIIAQRVGDSAARIVLSGHSGGGSAIFGYLNAAPVIPDQVERIAFLDANYAYDTDRHKDKLAAWLKASPRHFLGVLAYDDANALYEGKPFVSASGGTWGRSHQMLSDLESIFPFTKTTAAGMERSTAIGGQVRFWLKGNPERKIFHTVQVERNGFIEAILFGTALEGKGYTYFGDRAYTRWIRKD